MEWPYSPGEVTEQDVTEYKKSVSCGVVSSMNRPEPHFGQSYLSWKEMAEDIVQEMHRVAD